MAPRRPARTRLSPLAFNSVRMTSAPTLLHRVKFAGFATVGAIVQPVLAEADGMLRLAICAIFLALAVSLFFVALRANYRPVHLCSPGKRPREILGHPAAASKTVCKRRCVLSQSLYSQSISAKAVFDAMDCS